MKIEADIPAVKPTIEVEDDSDVASTQFFMQVKELKDDVDASVVKIPLIVDFASLMETIS